MKPIKSLSPPSQLLIRQADQIRCEALLVVNPPDHEWRTEFPVAGGWHLHAGWFHAWQELGEAHQFGTAPPQQQFDAALVWLPKEKKLTDYMLQQLAALLPKDAPIWLVGDNRSGIKSIAKQIEGAFSPAQKVANGNHSTLLVTTLVAPLEQCELDAFQHIFSVPPNAGNAAEEMTAPLQVASLPGVFAHPGIDAGSTMLLQHLPRFKPGSVLDFACGNGVLGASLQRQQPGLQLTYLDVSAMALAACAKTLELNGLNGELIAADHLSADLPKYNYIVSHPPFHTGQATDYSIGQQFLRNAREHLAVNGELWLVANRFLPWPELIEASFGHCERIAQDTKFAVYRAVHKVQRAVKKGRRR
ncbi:class I SAM-dependent methyltransferase [Pseudidiomarina sp. 1APP75-27a]|uniref:class I SAM-dependent methyltransferase n=1 Tax=Pseudidiomarina terrestris TaxID=2820060 RepID=UPI00264B28D0|nr:MULTISPECIES: class I SAM-dependent methyltransferase [unclassified Pseudidiomarina]MDN7136891.1 class I SAM-dependent methyltransferase [Pseudidiomarina sp. 1ASP75-14]MEA3587785.1 class I SAM-dependent methyltransferase [Pseudidiomarina sp. 1APP75-27a]